MTDVMDISIAILTKIEILTISLAAHIRTENVARILVRAFTLHCQKCLQRNSIRLAVQRNYQLHQQCTHGVIYIGRNQTVEVCNIGAKKARECGLECRILDWDNPGGD